MIKLSDKPLASSSASGDKIFINRNGAIMQVGMSSFSPPIVPSATGNVIPITDSSDRPLVDLTVFGNTSQNGTPTPTAPIPLDSVENPTVTINGKNLLENKSTSLTTDGITFTVNDDKSVTVKGTPTSNPARYLNSNLTLPIGNYVLSGGGTSASVKLIIRITKSGGGYTYVESSGKETLFSVTAENVDLPRIAYIYVSGNEAVDTIIYPMIRLASIADGEYEPYKAQSLSIPYTLNGVGDVKDYVDFERGVLVKKIKALTPKTVISGYPTANGQSFVAVVANDAGYTDNAVANDVMCDYLPTVSSNAQYTSNESSVSGGSSRVMFTIKDVTTKADVEQWLNDNPITILYSLAQPTETPLTEAELNAFKALHTYKPNTVITNSENAEMGVEYVADTKNYIDNKLASLVASTTTDTTEV